MHVAVADKPFGATGSAISIATNCITRARSPGPPHLWKVVNALTGQPVPSASVAIAPITQGADRDISRSITTGADGRFAFVALSRGKYSLMAKARGASLQYFDHHDPFATAIAVGPGLDTDHLVFRLHLTLPSKATSPTTTTSPSRTRWCASFRRAPRADSRRPFP